jgi:hypothetical protein
MILEPNACLFARQSGFSPDKAAMDGKLEDLTLLFGFHRRKSDFECGLDFNAQI